MPRERTNIGLEYSQKRVWVSPENIDEFEPAATIRQIRIKNVRKLVAVLESKKCFPPMTVNLKRGKYRVIDGNHRLESLRGYLDKHPEHKVELELDVYTDLTEEQEKVVYNALADVAKQTTSDLIEQNKDDIPVYQMTQSGNFPIPISVYGSPNSMKVASLLSAYLAATEPKFQGGLKLAGNRFVGRVKELGRQEFQVIKSFSKDFVEAFGTVKANPFARVTPFGVLFRIWLDNKERVPQPDMVKLFKKKILAMPEVSRVLKQSGMGAGVFQWNLFIDTLNTQSRYTFVKSEPTNGNDDDDDEIELEEVVD